MYWLKGLKCISRNGFRHSWIQASKYIIRTQFLSLHPLSSTFCFVGLLLRLHVMCEAVVLEAATAIFLSVYTDIYSPNLHQSMYVRRHNVLIAQVQVTYTISELAGGCGLTLRARKGWILQKKIKGMFSIISGIHAQYKLYLFIIKII